MIMPCDAQEEQEWLDEMPKLKSSSLPTNLKAAYEWVCNTKDARRKGLLGEKGVLTGVLTTANRLPGLKMSNGEKPLSCMIALQNPKSTTKGQSKIRSSRQVMVRVTAMRVVLRVTVTMSRQAVQVVQQSCNMVSHTTWVGGVAGARHNLRLTIERRRCKKKTKIASLRQDCSGCRLQEDVKVAATTVGK